MITIKGTERSVRTAQDLIEEALSTPSKDIESSSSTLTTTTTTDKPNLVPNVKTQSNNTATSSSQTVCNPWNQTQFTPSSSSPWGQKRYSDIVPPVSLLKPNSSSQEEPKKPTSVAPPMMRRTSLPVKIQNQSSQEIPTSLGNIKCGGIPLSNGTCSSDNSTPDSGSNKPNDSTSSSSTQSSTVSAPSTGTIAETKDATVKQVVAPSPRNDLTTSTGIRQPRHSVTLGPLSSVKEDEETSEDVDPPKQKRSLSDPLVLRRPAVVDVTDGVSILDTITPSPFKKDTSSSPPLPSSSPRPRVTSSVSTPSVTVTLTQTQELTTPPSTPAPTSNDTKQPSSEPPQPSSSVSTSSIITSVGVAVIPPEPTTTSRTTRTVGIVTPTQSVKLFQVCSTVHVSQSFSHCI